jgi:hypothetical protein
MTKSNHTLTSARANPLAPRPKVQRLSDRQLPQVKVDLGHIGHRPLRMELVGRVSVVRDVSGRLQIGVQSIGQRQEQRGLATARGAQEKSEAALQGG